MAARSLKLTAAAYHPNSSYVMPAARWRSNVTTSVVSTVPSPMTAASSPGPTLPSDLMKLMKSLISRLSPTSPILAIAHHYCFSR